MAEEKKNAVVSLGNVNGIEYIRKDFETDPKKPTPFDGLGFAVPRFTNMQQAVEHLDALCKAQNRKDESGNSILLELIHTAIDGKLRTKVKNDVAEFPDTPEGQVDMNNWWAKKHEQANANGGLLFTAQDCSTWVPGSRGLGEKKLRDSLVSQLQDLLTKQGKTLADKEVQDIVSRIGAMAA